LFSVLFYLSFLSYLMRQNIHVAGEFMMPELGISEIEMGWIYAAFIWGYALCQLPGGVFGKLLGPRVALTCAGVVWVITTGLTGWLPGELFTTGAGVIGCLLVVRFFVGVAHAPIYPIQAAVVERWFPVGHWALPNAVGSTGLTLGAALAQPLVAVVMVYWGWRASFYVFIPLGIALFWLWWRYATDEPAEHPAMT
jgi:MFS family permease